MTPPSAHQRRFLLYVPYCAIYNPLGRSEADFDTIELDQSLPGSSTHIMTGNEAGETFGIVDQSYEASEAELVFGSVIRDGHASARVRPCTEFPVRRYQWKTFNLSGSVSTRRL